MWQSSVVQEKPHPDRSTRNVRIWRSLDEVPADLGRTVVTVGNFDGVHLGHQHVIRRAREVAGEVGVERVVAVTFDPHPFAVLRPEHAPVTLTGIDRRVELLAEAGVDDVLVLPFTREVASWSPERFVTDILVDALHARAVVVGSNFRFGSKAAGEVATLHELGSRYDFVAEGIALDGGPQVWSSTYIRSCLAAGDVEGATEALGHPFAVRGVVVKGDQRGRALGFPTANVPTDGMYAAPADGVYAGWLRRRPSTSSGQGTEGDPMPAAISVGTNPTFDGVRERRVESYVLDRDDLELYGVPVEVSFVTRIRGMKRFDSVDHLVATMGEDCERVRLALGVPDPS
jgi:riboflavin kinase/FMN adenylyltransferase